MIVRLCLRLMQLHRQSQERAILTEYQVEKVFALELIRLLTQHLTNSRRDVYHLHQSASAPRLSANKGAGGLTYLPPISA